MAAVVVKPGKRCRGMKHLNKLGIRGVSPLLVVSGGGAGLEN